MASFAMRMSYGKLVGRLPNGEEVRIGYERGGCRIAVTQPNGAFPIRYMCISHDENDIWEGSEADAQFFANDILSTELAAMKVIS